ncbi:putative Lupus La protein [Paratrimastix pyriformis]|uniref:Lupus La protein n=1 Tax=Paratrimastix pyriformis TaxID=342808 RepID=A0ABQ8UE43_9EUKA|nr:putative Lupus La protein [Paratrimastix pyriformis]
METPAAAPAAAPAVPAALPALAPIKKQIEFYFSDSNLPKDRFLLAETKKNEAGWVEIALVATFNKMRQLNATVEAIIAALQGNELMEISEDQKRMRRKMPLPEKDDSEDRTIYAKSFPHETTLDELEHFFGQWGELNAVRMRRIPKSKTFKGSVLVEYKSKVDADKVLALAPAPQWKEAPLTIQSMKSWAEEEAAKPKRQKKEKKEKPEGGDQEAKPEERPFVWTPACVAAVTKFASLKHLEFLDNAVEGYARFDTPDGAQKGLAGLATEQINGAVPTVRLLQGEEEVAYWDKLKGEGEGEGEEQQAGQKHGREEEGDEGAKVARTEEPAGDQ